MTRDEFDNDMRLYESRIAEAKREIADLTQLEKKTVAKFIASEEERFNLHKGDKVTITYKDRHKRNSQLSVDGYFICIHYNGEGIFKLKLNKINKDGSMSKLPVSASNCPCLDEIIYIQHTENKVIEPIVMDLVKNCKSLDGDVSEIVDVEFWNMIKSSTNC